MSFSFPVQVHQVCVYPGLECHNDVECGRLEKCTELLTPGIDDDDDGDRDHDCEHKDKDNDNDDGGDVLASARSCSLQVSMMGIVMVLIMMTVMLTRMMLVMTLMASMVIMIVG